MFCYCATEVLTTFYDSNSLAKWRYLAHHLYLIESFECSELGSHFRTKGFQHLHRRVMLSRRLLVRHVKLFCLRIGFCLERFEIRCHHILDYLPQTGNDITHTLILPFLLLDAHINCAHENLRCYRSSVPGS